MQIILEGVTGSGELWLDIMKIICGNKPTHPASNMCDIMCHRAPYTPLLGFAERTYIDIQDRGFDFPEEKNNFICMDAIAYLMDCPVDYDVIICSDGIEHLTINQGERLLQLMRLNSEMQVIFTPLGDYMVDVGMNNNPDSHLSGWTPGMLPDYLSIVFPNFHESLNIGAFFAVNCSIEEKQKIFKEIKSKYDQN